MKSLFAAVMVFAFVSAAQADDDSVVDEMLGNVYECTVSGSPGGDAVGCWRVDSCLNAAGQMVMNSKAAQGSGPVVDGAFLCVDTSEDPEEIATCYAEADLSFIPLTLHGSWTIFFDDDEWTATATDDGGGTNTIVCEEKPNCVDPT